MATNGNKKSPKIPKKFECVECDYFTSNKKDFEKHCDTIKHKNVVWQQFSTEFVPKIPRLECENCHKTYKDRTGLWRHKKKCDITNCKTDSTDKELVMLLIKENMDFKNIMMEVIKNGTHNTINNTTHTNSHNKSFNLNFFLNETCKDAMNITDFIHSLKIQLTDLENVGEVGFVNGITNIIVQNLKSLDITQRPVHCTDAKREVLYIKDENKWEKEGDENIKLRKAIKHIAFKNTKMLPEFRKKHPDCGKSESKYADQYNKLIIEAMGGKGENDKEKEDRIIKNIAKEVIIDK